jgi:hypothetical protein
MKIDIPKPNIMAMVDTNHFGILKKTFMNCVNTIIIGIAKTVSQKFI